MSSELVVITGVTGHVGFRILRAALESGYKVRAIVRSEAKAEQLRSNQNLKNIEHVSKLHYIIVPDFTVPGAFITAVEGAKYIIHVGSPLASGSPDDGGRFIFLYTF